MNERIDKIKAKAVMHREPIKSAHIIKSAVPNRQGYFLVNGECHKFFTRYREAKDYAEGMGWAAERC